ncbi:ethanolamine ammonia-lyase subunit EutC [Frateuria defendens]|uniref:ethanolamine ammonia-lyase subunit EutC n=1 Tax=Frateuria defendens TaxID=2219559 RepID=UPI00066FBFC8|nr:ethanolamine ammonia-lyase subunit EutC [Frateuria defendens]
MTAGLDPFARLRALTRARIGLGRSGDALPTRALLDFQAAASQARDAVHAAIDLDALRRALAPRACIEVASRAPDRTAYLARPDWGRELGQGMDALDAARGDYDLAFVIADGLSATAAMAHALPLLDATRRRLAGWSIAPMVLARQARVALGDAVAQRLGARMVAVLIGERPGLSVADSLGVYLTWAPRAGHPDALRNCLSNIHAHGLDYERASGLLAALATEARQRRLTGTALKLDVSLPASESR